MIDLERVRRALARMGGLERRDRNHAVEERAAILEYDAGFPREEAERRARLEILGPTPARPTWPWRR